jgi:tripartite-type tricarboxylate transporter receptor subunit TctC
MELMNAMAGVQMVHVPYKGAAPSIVALVSGEVQMVFSSVPVGAGAGQGGQDQGAGVSIAKRSSVLPDVPTISESGVPGFDAASWYGVFAPAGRRRTPSPRSEGDRQNHERQEMRDRFASDGFEPAGLGPAEFGGFFRAELAKWSKAIALAGVKPE